MGCSDIRGMIAMFVATCAAKLLFNLDIHESASIKKAANVRIGDGTKRITPRATHVSATFEVFRSSSAHSKKNWLKGLHNFIKGRWLRSVGPKRLSLPLPARIRLWFEPPWSAEQSFPERNRLFFF